MAARVPSIEEVLTSAGLPALIDKFTSEKVDTGILTTLTDDDLIRLGVCTIGDRIRFRDAARRKIQPLQEENVAQSDNGRLAPRLFPGFRTASGRNFKKKGVHGGSWTAQFFGLSSKDQEKTPTTSEKEILNKTGLGLKKIKLGNNMNEGEVVNLLQSEEGFPKLKDCGGFEMLRTLQNGRTLVQVPTPWTSKSLKINVGPQARIYLRPIQKSLSVQPVVQEEVPSVTVACNQCQQEMSVHELRNHIRVCEAESNYMYVLLQNTGSSDNATEEQNLPDMSLSEHNNSQNVGGQDFLGVDLTSYNAQDQSSGTEVFTEGQELPDLNQPSHSAQGLLDVEVNVQSVQQVVQPAKTLKESVENCIQFCRINEISNPVEMLRKIQTEIVTGRPLELEDLNSSIEGDTNFINIDRERVLETGMEEIGSIPAEELRKTLEVQFYSEKASDYGGPRKEFFRLILVEIKEKYFDSGIRDLLAPDYRTVGIILALSILQNGKMPVFLSPELVEDIFNTDEPSSSAVKYMREGLNVLGLYDLFMSLPELKFLLQPCRNVLTMKRITTILKPKFSAEGSNSYRFEKEVYSQFNKYLREVSAGRRGNLSLSSILVFVTSTDEEPLLGFKIQPSIVFCEVGEGFLPTSSTCVNSLTLPRPSSSVNLPETEALFNLYDLAFSNAYYGLQ